MESHTCSRRIRTAVCILVIVLGRATLRAQGDGAPAPPCVRKPQVAGTFYPQSSRQLRQEIERLLDAASVPRISGTVRAIIAPHAGYRYSAAVAAHAFKSLGEATFDTVVIIGHDAHVPGIAALVANETHWDTPLGRVPVDTELVTALDNASPTIIVRSFRRVRDHTVEVQLPFLQCLGFKGTVVPILFGTPGLEQARTLAAALADTAGDRRLLVVASTDLSHRPTYTDAVRVDRETMDTVLKLDADALFRYLEEVSERGIPNLQTAMCASGGVATAIEYARRTSGVVRIELLNMANSGDVPGGSRTEVVGYAAAVLYATEETPMPPAGNTPAATPEPAPETVPEAAPAPAVEAAAEPPPETGSNPFVLPANVQRELLTLARARITAAALGQPLDYRPPQGIPELNGPAAVFVTLHCHGRLRGCIGMTEARVELWRAVYEMAFSAAFRDPRFPPVSTAELRDLHIEISVLSPLRKVTSHDVIRPHTHGVVVRRHGRSGLFLPQVWKQLPTKEAFLTRLCTEKAHLPAEAWKNGSAELLVFTVFAFSETED